MTCPTPADTLTADALQRFLAAEGLDGEGSIVVEALGQMSARLRCRVTERNRRPGGTVSGPTLMMLADCALYAALLGHIGLVPLAVTSSLSISFLRKPALRDVIGTARLLRVGRSLAYGEVTLVSDGESDPVAHCTCTYAIPRGPVS